MYARVRKALPELYAFTVCMWLRSRSGGTGQGTPFSYSVPGQANEIVLLEAGHDPMELLINDKVSGGGRRGRDGGRSRPFGSTALRWAPHLWDLAVLPLSVFGTHAKPPAFQVGFGEYKDKPDLGWAGGGLMPERGCERGVYPFAGGRGTHEAHSDPAQEQL